MKVFFVLLFAALVVGPNAGFAQDYPTRPIQLVVPYTAGSSSTDIIGRKVADFLKDKLGRNVVVDNKPGANGTIGTSFVARATPDGYTLLVGVNAPVVLAPFMQKVDYDPVQDFRPIAMAAITPYVLVVPASSPFKSIADLISFAKANPGEVKYSSTGFGSGAHLSGAMLAKMAGVDLKHVPYSGVSAATNDLLTNRVQFSFTGVTAVKGLIDEKQLRPLAMASPKRSPLLPDVPTMDEAGLKAFDTGTWVAIMAPSKTPAPALAKLDAAMRDIVTSAEFREFVLSSGSEPSEMKPDELRSYIADSVERWRDLARSVGEAAPK